MVHDPKRSSDQNGRGGSLLYFLVAIVVLLSAALLEQAQSFPPLQISGTPLFILLVVALLILAYRLRRALR